MFLFLSWDGKHYYFHINSMKSHEIPCVIGKEYESVNSGGTSITEIILTRCNHVDPNGNVT